MRVDGNGGNRPNYSPTSGRGPVPNYSYTETPIALEGTSTRGEYPTANRADDFEQAGLLYRVMTPDERDRLIENIARHMRNVNADIQRRQISHFLKADIEYGKRVARALNLQVEPFSAS